MGKNKEEKRWKKAKLIANPGSGEDVDHTERLEQVTHWLLDLGIKVDVALAHPTEKTTPIARRAAKDGYPLVIAMGGDGTIEAVARGLVGEKTCLGILRGGTMNNIAKSLGIPEDLQEGCKLLVEGCERCLDVGQVKTKKGKFTFLEMAAVGVLADQFSGGKDLDKGEWWKLPSLVVKFVHYDLPEFRINLNKESYIEEDSLLLTVSNMPLFGESFLVAPQASVEDGLLDVCLYNNLSKPELAAYFAKIANEGEAKDENILRFRARKLKIKTKPKQRIMADGKMLGKGKAKIRVLPGALRVITPEELGFAREPAPEDERLPVPISPTQD
jgi:YegS/Rv2252/BmrU family lipid kinase